jgi:pimeloyl-ACP methyl ester carboxylesterase
MPPTLVLLPGMDGTGELFSPFLASLGSDFETLIVRYPTNEVLSLAEFTALAQSKLPADKRFVLLAESFSGPIAISIAASKPKGLAGLILCATFAKNPRPMLRYLILPLGLFPLNWIPRCILSGLFLGRFATEELRTELKGVIEKVDRAVLRRRLWSTVNVDVSKELARIHIPSLYLTASEDRLVPSAAARPFGTLSTRWKIAKILGPHLLMQAVLREVAKVTRNFIENLA